MAIRNVTQSEAVNQTQQTSSNIVHAAQDAHYFPLYEKWQPIGYLTSKGARVEARPWGKGFRYRLNGYAQDGSDVL